MVLARKRMLGLETLFAHKRRGRLFEVVKKEEEEAIRQRVKKKGALLIV